MSAQTIPATDQPTKRTGCMRKFLITSGVMLLLAIAAGAAFFWWHNRPITPVVLNSKEQQALNQKVESVQERKYQPGTKTIILTEREVNALFHHNTGLGDKIRFELATNAVHTRIRTELDKDLPVVGGRTLRAKARFLLTDTDGTPALILDDLTVWGVSLPNAWLSDIKGQNMLANIGLDMSDNRVTAGINSLSIDHGKITIKLAE